MFFELSGTRNQLHTSCRFHNLDLGNRITERRAFDLKEKMIM